MNNLFIGLTVGFALDCLGLLMLLGFGFLAVPSEKDPEVRKRLVYAGFGLLIMQVILGVGIWACWQGLSEQ